MSQKMVKSVLILSVYMVLVSADLERPGRYLPHDRTIVNCARYKREANQHSCVLAPFSTEGPYFLPDDLERSDITEGHEGVDLELNLQVVNANDCSPLSGLFVHIWQANALGHYSGVEEIDVFVEDTFRPVPISNSRFLRGYQITDENGQVTFKTILPGWYFGRSLHIHVEVYAENTTEFNKVTYIGQLYFDVELPIVLHLLEPYTNNNNQLTLNNDDIPYLLAHGNESLLELDHKLDGKGFTSSYTMAIDPTILTNPVEVMNDNQIVFPVNN